MQTQAQALWTIDQLGAQVALALSVDYPGAPNARVRDLPDRRTIRYYTTLGLLDRPAEMRGRVALYGPKHLLQLVAIKRLQARGLSLAEIQQQLLGLSETALREISRLPHNFPSPPTESVADKPAGLCYGGRGEAFWSTAPVSLPAEKADNDEHQTSKPGPDQPATLQGIRLGEEVTLLLEGLRPIYDDDLAAIRIAAAPLLKILEKRRLLRPHDERGTP